MRLTQLAITLVCGAAMISPAFAQSTTVPPMPKAATTMPAMPNMATPKAPAMPAATTPAATTPAATAPATMSAPTNINTASAADLDKLPQIGKARAKKIILGRPYKSTDELVTKKVLSQGVFNKIKDKITAS